VTGRVTCRAYAVCVCLGCAAVCVFTLPLLYRAALLWADISAVRSARAVRTAESQILTAAWYAHPQSGMASDLLSQEQPVLFVVTSDGCVPCATTLDTWVSALAAASGPRGRVRLVVATAGPIDQVNRLASGPRTAGLLVTVVRIKDVGFFRLVSGIHSVPMSLVFWHGRTLAAAVGGIPSPGAVAAVLAILRSPPTEAALFVEHNPGSLRLR